MWKKYDIIAITIFIYMQRGSNPLTKEEYRKLFEMMIEYVKNSSDPGHYKKFPKLLFSTALQTANTSQKSKDIINNFLDYEYNIVGNGNEQKDNFLYIVNNVHPLSERVEEGKSVYRSVYNDVGSGYGHSFLVKITNTGEGKYAYNIFNIAAGEIAGKQFYNDFLKNALSKDSVIEAVNGGNPQEARMRKAKIGNTLKHIHEQEVNVCNPVEQGAIMQNSKILGVDIYQATHMTPILFLLGELHKEGEIDIEVFKNAISSNKKETKEEGSKLDLANLTHNENKNITTKNEKSNEEQIQAKLTKQQISNKSSCWNCFS